MAKYLKDQINVIASVEITKLFDKLLNLYNYK